MTKKAGNYIRALHLENFKCFSDLKLEMAPLTLFTGFNGGGKSTALQPLLLLAQAERDRAAAATLPLNGSLVRLGTAGDVLRGHSDDHIKFTVAFDGFEHSWEFITRAGARFLREVVPHVWAHDNRSLLTVFEQLSYISAVREGAAEAYPIPDNLGRGIVDVGMDGRYASYWYNQLADDEVTPARCHASEPAPTFRKQMDAWLGSLFPGAQVNVQLITSLSKLSLEFRLSEIGAWRRPANIGYGLTYSFPIIVALLGALPGQVIVIDSPEAHLHPHAQSLMGQMLAQFAASGVQIVVETHSDHILNGVRLAVKNGIVKANDVSLYFFGGATEETHGVVAPRVNNDGKIDEWPEGFFDQADKDIARLCQGQSVFVSRGGVSLARRAMTGTPVRFGGCCRR